MSADPEQLPVVPAVRTLKGDTPVGAASVSDISFTSPQQQVTTAAQIAPTQTTHSKPLFDVEQAFSNSNVQVGTIVTDKKRTRASFTSVLKSAFDEWWSSTSSSVKGTVEKLSETPKEAPKIEVPETRTNIIQEAAKYARQAPRDDHAIVVEKIRTFAHDAEKIQGKPYVIKNPTQTSYPFATTKKSGVAPQQTTESAHDTDSRVEVKASLGTREPLASYADQPLFKKHVAAQEVSAITVSPLAKKPSQPSSGGWTHYTDTSTVPASEAVPPSHLYEEMIHEKALPAIPPEVLERSPEIFEKPKIAPIEPPLPPLPSRMPHTSVPIPSLSSTTPHDIPVSHFSFLKTLIFSGVIVAGAAFGIYAAMLAPTTSPSEDTSIVGKVSVPTFLAVDNQTAIELPNSKKELLNGLTQQLQNAQESVTQFYPAKSSEGMEPASAEEIMSVLSPRTSGTFIRSLGDTLMFGAVGESMHEPFIVLQSSNFDAAFAGMLAWEKDMSADLAPFFGSPVLATLPPVGYANASNPRFIDALRANRSVRILYDETGKERIVYAFVSKDLIIITTSTGALGKLVERLK